MGVVMALQFGPQLLLLPWTGFAADHLDRRKLLIATQAAMGLLALGLGLLTVTGLVQLWHVYLFAFLLGCVNAVDAPARQTFVSDLVGDEDLVERGGAEFHLLQRRADDRSRGRRRPDRRRRLRLGVFDQRGLVCRRARARLGFCASTELHAKTRASRTRGSLVEGFRMCGPART